MSPRVLPTAGPALDKSRWIDQARMKWHEPTQELPHRRQIAILGAKIRKPLIKPRPIGLQTGAIEATQVWVLPLLDPTDKEAAALEIGPGRGGCRFPLRELPGELVEIDPQNWPSIRPQGLARPRTLYKWWQR